MKSTLTFSLLLLLMILPSQLRAQTKFALVIGNKNYGPLVGGLTNPHNDIKLVAEALSEMGSEFETVQDGDRASIVREVGKLSRALGRAGPDAIGFLYYSGHGVSRPLERTNYIIPIEIRDMNDPEIWWKAISVEDVVVELKRNAPNATNFLVFDACRSELRVSTKGAEKGFAPIIRHLGMFIATSTGQTHRH